MDFEEARIEQIVDRAIAKNQRILNIENDVSALKSDVSTLKSDVSTLKSDVSTLKSDVHHQGLLYEAMQSDIKLILDAVVPLRKQSETFADLVATLTNHDVRLTAVENSFKHHLTDKHAHA